MKPLVVIAMAMMASVPTKSETIEAGSLRISPESRDLILYYETGGASYYTSRLQRPTVPPGMSGITVGIGYDLGYNTPAQIRSDWSGKLPAPQVERLAGVSGLKQASARAALPRVRDISIPWATAVEVYEEKTVPRFAALTVKAYPGIKVTPAHVQGVILSTTFNRGAAMADNPKDSQHVRRRELRWTRDDIQAGRLSKLSSYQLQMRRLWPNILGLQRRYAAQAGLIDKSNSSEK